jgi:hypothetical protein
MSVAIRIVVVGSMIALASLPARADAADERSVQVGGGVGLIGSWFSDSGSGGVRLNGRDVRVSVPVSARGDVETLFALASNTDDTLGFYGVQFKQRMAGAHGFQPFLTYGGIGIFYLEGHESMVTPPFIGLVGGGVERRIIGRVSARVDVQAVVALVIPAGVRVAAGVSIPVGRPRSIAE